MIEETNYPQSIKQHKQNSTYQHVWLTWKAYLWNARLLGGKRDEIIPIRTKQDQIKE